MTLDEDPRSRVQWNSTILLVDHHKMDPWPLNEGWRPKSDKSRLNLHDTILEGKSIGSNQKKNKKKESPWFEDSRCKLGSKARSNSRIQFASHKSKLVSKNFNLRSTPSKVGLSLAFHKMSKLIWQRYWIQWVFQYRFSIHFSYESNKCSM